MPFREAHGVVGKLLRHAETAGAKIRDLTDEEWEAVHPLLLQGGRPAVSAESSVEARSVPGGTARAAVQFQLVEAYAALG
jgi:argininosuccinate lyase